MTQYFKGDTTEQRFLAAGQVAFDQIGLALDSFYSGGSTAADFLLMLYDSGRVPFTDRVPREAFVDFFREAVSRFASTGTFEAYLFILKGIFGPDTEVLFDVPGAGKLEMVINAGTTKLFDLIVTQWSGSFYEDFTLITHDDDTIQVATLSGIDSQGELEALLAELIPAGIFPDITLTFFEISGFIAVDASSVEYLVVDHLDNQIIFVETEV
jgi:hypothetical protein